MNALDYFMCNISFKLFGCYVPYVMDICGVGGKNMTATVRARLVDMLEFMRMELVGGMGNGFALPPSAFATGAWEPEQEVVESIHKQAEELLRALG